MKATIVLGVIALGLLGYILIFERGSLGTRELEARQGSVLPELIRARVTKLEIQQKGVTTVLERKLEGTDEEMLWSVTAPYQAEADQDAVDTVLGDLEWLHPKRTLRDVGAEDMKRFGLNAPRYRAWFTSGRERILVQVGTETPQHDGIYVTSTEPKTVYVVGKDFAEALGQAPEHYHTKTLHEGVLTSTARKIEVRDAAGMRVTKRGKDGLWRVVEPGASKDMLAATEEITSTIEGTDQLRATRYVTSDKGALARYGLDPAQLDLSIHKRGKIDMEGKGNEGDDVLAIRVRVGAPCEGQPTERYVTVGEAGVVFCAQGADLDKLQLPAERLFEKKLLPIDPKDVRAIRLQRGDRSLFLERIGGIPQAGEAEPWRFEQKHRDKVVAEGEARSGSIKDFLDALRATEALADQSATGSVQGADFTASFKRDESRPELVFQIALRGLETTLVQRPDEPRGVAFAPAAAELLDPSAAPFKPQMLLSLNEANLRSLELTRSGAKERLERANAGAPFSIKAPIEADADRLATSDVARLLSGLQAVRFVADAAEPAHALDPPLVAVRAQYAAQGEGSKPQTVQLSIGAATEGGHFARLDASPDVFVVSAQLVDLLRAPLVSRTLLAAPRERIAAIEVAQAGKKARVQRAGESYEIAGRSGDPALAETARALVQTIATLRALTAVSYGEPTADQGFKAPFATLRIEQTGAEPIDLVLGGQAPSGDRFARLAGLAATFLIPSAAADALVAPLR